MSTSRSSSSSPSFSSSAPSCQPSSSSSPSCSSSPPTGECRRRSSKRPKTAVDRQTEALSAPRKFFEHAKLTTIPLELQHLVVEQLLESSTLLERAAQSTPPSSGISRFRTCPNWPSPLTEQDELLLLCVGTYCAALRDAAHYRLRHHPPAASWRVANPLVLESYAATDPPTGQWAPEILLVEAANTSGSLAESSSGAQQATLVPHALRVSLKLLTQGRESSGQAVRCSPLSSTLCAAAYRVLCDEPFNDVFAWPPPAESVSAPTSSSDPWQESGSADSGGGPLVLPFREARSVIFSTAAVHPSGPSSHFSLCDLRSVRRLSCENCTVSLLDLDSAVRSDLFSLRMCNVKLSTPASLDLCSLSGLHTLELCRPPSTVTLDLSSLGHVHTLRLERCAYLGDLGQLAGSQLHTLALSHLDQLTDLSKLARCAIHTLSLCHLDRVTDLRGVESVYNLSLTELPLLSCLAPAGGVHTLLLRCMPAVSEVAVLRSVHTLSLRYLQSVRELGSLSGVHTLELLDLPRVQQVGALAGVHTLSLCGMLRVFDHGALLGKVHTLSL